MVQIEQQKPPLREISLLKKYKNLAHILDCKGQISLNKLQKAIKECQWDLLPLVKHLRRKLWKRILTETHPFQVYLQDFTDEIGGIQAEKLKKDFI